MTGKLSTGLKLDILKKPISLKDENVNTQYEIQKLSPS
jgi:hypothetical protein